MSRKQRKPTWLVPYGLVILMIVALVLGGRDGLPSWANEIADIGIVLLVFGGMLLWVRINISALWAEELKDLDKDELTIDEYEPVSPPSKATNENRKSDSKPMFKLDESQWFIERGK